MYAKQQIHVVASSKHISKHVVTEKKLMKKKWKT